VISRSFAPVASGEYFLRRPNFVFWIIGSGVLVVGAPDGYAQPGGNAGSEGKSIQITRVDEAPLIDGLIDEAVWSLAVPIEDLHQVNPV